MTKLCIRQYLEEPRVSGGNQIPISLHDRPTRKNTALKLLQNLLQGIDEYTTQGKSFGITKGFDASAHIKFDHCRVLTLLGIKEAANGVELDLIIEQRCGKVRREAEHPAISHAEVVRSVIDSNFPKLFHTKADWKTRAEFEASFEE